MAVMVTRSYIRFKYLVSLVNSLYCGFILGTRTYVLGKTGTFFFTNFLVWEKYKNNFSLRFHYFCDFCRIYAYDILPKIFISGILALAMKCNMLTEHCNRTYAGNIPKFEVTFWSPFTKRFIFNAHFTMASVLGLVHVGPKVKLLLICKLKLVFYNDEQYLIFVYSIKGGYCQHESINVGWKIVKFL
jgi:hypothetical protein